MYETLVLVDESASLRLDRVREAIAARFPASAPDAPTVTADERSVELAWDGFRLTIRHSAAAHVREESAEIAAVHGRDGPERAAMAACRERLEISGDDDPGMDRFNDFCLVIEAIEGCGRVYPFDPNAGRML